MARLDPRPILRGHWKSLNNRQYPADGGIRKRADLPARILTILLPAAAFVTSLVTHVEARASGGIGTLIAIALAWAALVASGLLGAFTLISGWRDRLTRRTSNFHEGTSGLAVRDLIDEASNHALLGVLDAIAIAALSVVALVASGRVLSVIIALVLALWAHTLFIFYLTSTRLYSAYVQLEQVGDHLNGFSQTVSTR